MTVGKLRLQEPRYGLDGRAHRDSFRLLAMRREFSLTAALWALAVVFALLLAARLALP